MKKTLIWIGSVILLGLSSLLGVLFSSRRRPDQEKDSSLGTSLQDVFIPKDLTPSEESKEKSNEELAKSTGDRANKLYRWVLGTSDSSDPRA